MTLQEFLATIDDVRDQDLRVAMVLALEREIPQSRSSYARFYRRIIQTLSRTRPLSRAA